MGLENLTVGAGQELIGGSDRKYTVKKKLTDAIDPQWVFYDVEEWDSGQVSKRLTAKLSHTQATREKVEQVIARWCRIKSAELPPDGGTISPNLDEVERQVDRR